MCSISYGFSVTPVPHVVTMDFVFVIYQCKAKVIVINFGIIAF